MQPSFRVFSVDIFLCYHVNLNLGEKEMCDEAKQRKKKQTEEKKETGRNSRHADAHFLGKYAEITTSSWLLNCYKINNNYNQQWFVKTINFWRLSL